MSHELRTPLNAVLGFSSLLLGAAQPLAQEARRQLGYIQTAGQHLLRLVDDLLELSNVEASGYRLHLDAVPLGEVVEQALAFVQPQARQRAIGLAGEVVDPGLRVHADAARLRQALLNLLTNAIKYNHAGGWVRVSVQADAGHAAVTVADGGIGMDAGQIAQLYQPFNRLGADSQRIEGLGIGLVVTRRLVELMQGTIAVASEPGQGSRFTLRLPLAAPA